jgi:DNA-directed RNA polymerase specialized sigma24 family protein
MALVKELSVDELLAQARNGSNEAITELFERWKNPVLKIIRKKRAKRLHSILDSDDVLQDICFILFRTHLHPSVFESKRTFLSYLIKIAENRVQEINRFFFLRKKRDLNREVHLQQIESLKESQHDQSPITEKILDQVVGRPGTIRRRIWNMFEMGFSVSLISKKLKLHAKVVERFLKVMATELNQAELKAGR